MSNYCIETVVVWPLTVMMVKVLVRGATGKTPASKPSKVTGVWYGSSV